VVEVVIRPPRAGDLVVLREKMRQADRDELAASTLDPLQTVLETSVRDSSMAWSAEIDGNLACIFGCAAIGSMLSRKGAPWMLGTDTLDRHPVILMKTCRGYITHMHETFPHLLNYVDARNVRSVRWLTRLGFTIHPAQPYGHAGLPFHLFEMR